MNPLYSIGDILWIKADKKRCPIKILGVDFIDHRVFYTFCSARDDAGKNADGLKWNYFEFEADLEKMVI